MKEGDAWLLANRAEGENTDGDVARDVVSKLNDLRILGRAETPPADGTAPVFELTLGTDAGTRVLRFFRPRRYERLRGRRRRSRRVVSRGPLTSAKR